MMANEKRLIDVTPLIDECNECMNIEWNKSVYTTWAEAEEDFRDRLLDAPTVDAVEVVHGRWISDEADVLFHCSECGTQISTSWDYDDLHWNYYPDCGAKMDLKGEKNVRFYQQEEAPEKDG